MIKAALVTKALRRGIGQLDKSPLCTVLMTWAVTITPERNRCLEGDLAGYFGSRPQWSRHSCHTFTEGLWPWEELSCVGQLGRVLWILSQWWWWSHRRLVPSWGAAGWKLTWQGRLAAVSVEGTAPPFHVPVAPALVGFETKFLSGKSKLFLRKIIRTSKWHTNNCI